MIEEKGIIKTLNDIIDEYHKCKINFPYFCKNYIEIKDKDEEICKSCNNYERCHNIKF